MHDDYEIGGGYIGTRTHEYAVTGIVSPTDCVLHDILIYPHGADDTVVLYDGVTDKAPVALTFDVKNGYPFPYNPKCRLHFPDGLYIKIGASTTVVYISIDSVLEQSD